MKLSVHSVVITRTPARAGIEFQSVPLIGDGNVLVDTAVMHSYRTDMCTTSGRGMCEFMGMYVWVSGDVWLHTDVHNHLGSTCD